MVTFESIEYNLTQKPIFNTSFCTNRAMTIFGSSKEVVSSFCASDAIFRFKKLEYS